MFPRVLSFDRADAANLQQPAQDCMSNEVRIRWCDNAQRRECTCRDAMETGLTQAERLGSELRDSIADSSDTTSAYFESMSKRLAR